MEICDPRNNITMCPLCDHACSYWKLVTACGTARASHLFDNPATVFFSIFMALWGVDAFVFISQILAYCLAEAFLVLVLVFLGHYFHAPLHSKIPLFVLRLAPRYMIYLTLWRCAQQVSRKGFHQTCFLEWCRGPLYSLNMIYFEISTDNKQTHFVIISWTLSNKWKRDLCLYGRILSMHHRFDISG